MKPFRCSVAVVVASLAVFAQSVLAQVYNTEAYARSSGPTDYVANRPSIFAPTGRIRADFSNGSRQFGTVSLTNNGWSLLTAEHVLNPADGRVLSGVTVEWGSRPGNFHTTITVPTSSVINYNNFTSGGWQSRYGFAFDVSILNLETQITHIAAADIYRGADLGVGTRQEMGGFGTLAWFGLPPGSGTYDGVMRGGWDLTRSTVGAFSSAYQFTALTSVDPIGGLSHNFGHSGASNYVNIGGSYLIASVHSFSGSDEYVPGRANGGLRTNRFATWYDSVVIPTPGSAALLILGACTAAARRRF